MLRLLEKPRLNVCRRSIPASYEVAAAVAVAVAAAVSRVHPIHVNQLEHHRQREIHRLGAYSAH